MSAPASSIHSKRRMNESTLSHASCLRRLPSMTAEMTIATGRLVDLDHFAQASISAVSGMPIDIIVLTWPPRDQISVLRAIVVSMPVDNRLPGLPMESGKRVDEIRIYVENFLWKTLWSPEG